jgi:hypothetical protein
VNPAVFHRRRVERFAQLLEEADGGPRHHSRHPLDPELADYVQLGRRFSGGAELLEGPDPEFRTSLRAMLVAAAEREGIGCGDGAEARQAAGARQGARARWAAGTIRIAGVRPVLSSRRTRGAIIVGLAAGTLALSGMSAASGDAMPGDALYGVKRSTESARLALAGSDLSRGQLYLEFAKNRVSEAKAVRTDVRGLAGVLSDMDTETTEGIKLLTTAAIDRRDPAALDVIDAFVAAQYPAVAGIVDGSRVRQSLALLDRISQRSDDLRANLSCGTPSVGADALGPQAPNCGRSGPANSRHSINGPTSNAQDPSSTRPESSPAAGPGAPSHGPGASPSPSSSASPSPSSGTANGPSLLEEIGGLLGGLL